MHQTHLFPTTVKRTRLEAKSKKNAFWVLEIVEQEGRYWLEKESGADGKVLDRRRWSMGSREHALHRFNKKVGEKLNPRRLSPRKYKKAALK